MAGNDSRRKLRTDKKNQKVITRKMQRTFSYITLLFFAAFFCLLIRIGYLQIVKRQAYSNKAIQHQNYKNTTLPYRRGDILDRNGVVLAECLRRYNVILEPKAILDVNGIYKEASVKAICDSFGCTREEVEEILAEHSDSYYYIFRKNVPYEMVEAYEKARSADHKMVKGVSFETEYERYYPFDSLASNVIGYTNAGNVGTYGIEQYYNNYLNGTDGRESGYYNSNSQLVKKVWEPVDGATVYSTIDAYVQKIVEEEIQKFLSELSAENIGVILMNPDNGEIYAMASNLGYNLNEPRDLSLYYPEGTVLEGQAQLDALNKMWRNFCVSDTYEPGSTFKPITVAAGLEEGLFSQNSEFYCGGHSVVSNWTISCNKKSGHGTLSVTESLMFSCNMALIDMAAKEGGLTFQYYQQHFGLGSKTGIDLPGEAAGILISQENLNETELATSSFGQGFNVTMVQMLSAYCSLVNGGYYYQPHVVSKIVNSEGIHVYENNGVLLHRTVSKATSEFIKRAAHMTVEAGTATPAKVEGYTVGGKTGTAQKGRREDKKYVVSFIGGAPAENPEVCIYVVIDEIDHETLYNSSRPATELTSKILSRVLPYLGIYPDGDIDYGVEYEGDLLPEDEVAEGTVEEGTEE